MEKPKVERNQTKIGLFLKFCIHVFFYLIFRSSSGAVKMDVLKGLLQSEKKYQENSGIQDEDIFRGGSNLHCLIRCVKISSKIFF